MKYSAGSVEGKRLFAFLLAMAERGQYDDDFLTALVAYRERYLQSEKFDIFFAKYALAHGNTEVALEYARQAEEKRPLNYMVWQLLAEIFTLRHEDGAALEYEGLCATFYGDPITAKISRSDLTASLAWLSKMMGLGNYAPFMSRWMVMGEKGLTARRHTLTGDFLPVRPGEKPVWWVGAYIEQEPLENKSWLVEQHTEDEGFLERCGADFVFDFQRAARTQGTLTVDEPEPVAIPLAGLTAGQRVDVRADGVEDSAWIGKGTFSYFRFDRRAEVRSAEPFVHGAPIMLRHSRKRRRVVLNILLDGLCWKEMIRENYRYVPNLVRFFSQGIIFNDHFSVAEYTFPSLATIKTGMYPHHSHIFNERAAVELPREHLALSEQMKGLGYYCATLMGDGTGVFCGCDRGFDRMIVNPYALFTYVGVERVVRQLEAFDETDQYLFLHTTDTHPWSARTYQVPLAAQTRLALGDRLAGSATEKASVYLPATSLYQEANRRGITQADRSLGVLFDYLTAHYDEEEYIVQVFSDHGVPIYDEAPDILSENQVGATLMMRGAGVPTLGFVDELTSAVDLYPIMGHHAGFAVPDYVDGHLPKALGGEGRDYAVSASVYPGQTYKLALRTKTHEFRLESKEAVDEDGTVDLSHAALGIYTRGEARKAVEDAALEAYFLRIARDLTASFNDEGHHWPEMRAARPLWFPPGDEEG